MTPTRILLVDDEPDIREVVEFSLGLDANLITRSCGSGREALTVAADWRPELILLDVMMPDMDGPSALLRLRESAATASIPVVFMTARAQTRELDLFRSLGAVGVIPKPFDPLTLAKLVRGYISVPDPFAELRKGFLQRVRNDAVTLTGLHLACRDEKRAEAALSEMRRIAHGLAGTGGIFGFPAVSSAAAALEHAIVLEDLPGAMTALDQAIDALMSCADTYGSSSNDSLGLLKS